MELCLDHYSYTIQDMIFTWATYNSAFSQLELCFRFLFFFLTICVLLFFIHSLHQYPVLLGQIVQVHP